MLPRERVKERGKPREDRLVMRSSFLVGGLGVRSEAKKHTNNLLEFVTKKEPAAQEKLSEYVKIWQSRKNLIFLIAVCVPPDRICLICEELCLHFAFCFFSPPAFFAQELFLFLLLSSE